MILFKYIINLSKINQQKEVIMFKQMLKDELNAKGAFKLALEAIACAMFFPAMYVVLLLVNELAIYQRGMGY